jgi:hypothetical protein
MTAEPRRDGLQLASLPRDPYSEKLKLNPCRRPKVTLTEGEIQAPPHVWRFLRELEADDQYKILHGGIETLICYRDFRIGGIDRDAGHWFLYENFGTYVIDRWLRELGFERRRSTREGRVAAESDTSAYAGHKWYQIDAAKHLVYAHALRELTAAIDSQIGQSRSES